MGEVGALLTPAEKAKDRRLMRLYRISLAEQKKIERFQKEHPCFRWLLGNNMGTDHCHSTGLIRGRLDWRINKAYGLLEKVAVGEKLSRLLMALALYNDAPPAVEALGGPRYGLIGQARVKKNMVYGGKP